MNATYTAEQIAAAEKFARSCKSRPAVPTGGEAFRGIHNIASKLGLVKMVVVYGPTGTRDLKYEAVGA